MRHGLLLVAIPLLVGCARYEYDVVQPESVAGHVGTKSDYSFAVEPLEYKLRTASNRLVMRIYNRSQDSITLRGEQSVVVDPRGQSHRFLTQTIAPDSFIKIILPPLRPRVYGSGGSIGIGVGGVYGSSGRYRGRSGYYGAGGYYDDWYDEPRYLTVYDDGTVYWDWDGEGDARLSLVFERAGSTFTHEFQIRRRKV